MIFFRKDEDLIAEERRKKTLERFKLGIESLKNTNPLLQVLSSVDVLNKDINDATKQELESSLGGRVALGAAEKLESTQRTVVGAASDVGRETLSLANLLADKTGIYDVDDELLEKQEQFIKAGLEGLVGEESVETVNRGGRKVVKIKEPEYAGGELVRDMTAILGSVFAGTKGVDKIGKLTATTNSGKKVVDSLNATKATRAATKFGKATIGGEIGVQFSVNPYEARLANILGEFVGEDQESLNSIIEYLEADDNKSELENRAGLFVEGLIFAGGLATLPATYFGSQALKNTFKNKEALMKALQDIKVKHEKGSLDLEGFKSIMKDASNALSADKTPPIIKQKPNELEDVSKLWQFSPNKFKRTISKLGLGKDIESRNFLSRLAPGIGLQEIFRPRGYFTPKTFELFNQGQAAKNGWVARAEDLGGNLEKQIEQVSTKYKKYKDIDKLKKRVNEALQDTDKIKTLPKALRQDVTDMRNTLDDFSEQLLELPNSVISKELKKTIRNNMGTWLHRSYDIFESSGKATQKYKSFQEFKKAYRAGDQEALDKMENTKVFGPSMESIKNILKDQKKYKRYDNVSLNNEALKEIDKILTKAAGTSTDNYFARMDNFFGSGRSMLSRRGDIDEPLRDLLGEVKSPSVNFLKSTIQINNFVEDYKFSKDFLKVLGGSQRKQITRVDQPTRIRGHVFNDGFIDPETGIRYMTQLKGKQYGALNGKYMTSEMAAMFGERQGLIGSLDQMNWYKNFLALKGYGQASKTVFNHITHLRNTLGGAFFTLANGQNPFSTKGKDAASAIYNKRFANVKKEEAVEYYNKLIDLDLVNTSARYGDIEQTFKDSADSSITKWLNNTTTTFGSAKATAKKYGQNIQDLYVAEDDYFKIINFEQELDTLLKSAKRSNFKMGEETLSFNDYIKVNPNYIKELETKAASIVRDTIPTYSLVPTGIKQLRKLPFGNYFSFPAEIVRTSMNIVKQGLSEVFLSGNRTIKARGIKRLGGFLGVGLFSNEGLNRLTKQFHGVTDEEEERLRHLNPYDYSKNSKFIYYRDKNGNLYQNDFSFIDPYDTIKRPLHTAIVNFAHGEKTKENLDKVLMDTADEVQREFLKPFIGEAMITKAIQNLRRGRTEEGYPIKGYDTADSIGDIAAVGVYEFYKALAPGALQQVPKTTKAFMGDQYEELADGKFAKFLEVVTAGSVGDKEYSRTGQVIANLTGFRFEKVEPEKMLEKKVKQYKRDLDDARKILNRGTGRLKTGDDSLQAIMDANARHYYAYKELKLAVDAARYLDVDARTAQLILEDLNIGRETINALNVNRYKPLLPEKNFYDNFQKESVQGSMGVNQLQYHVGQLDRAYSGLPMINISFTDEIDIEDFDTRTVSRSNIEFLRDPPNVDEAKKRLGKIEGGLIETEEDIPNTKDNPAKRINPLTGMPYIEEDNT